MEVLGIGELLADQAAAHDLPVDLDERAVGLVVEGHLGDAGDDERVDEPAQDGEHEHAEHGRGELADEATHHFTPRALMTMSMSLMPMNGAMIPPTP